ncbi:hypothetical protein EYF80_022853 [Liparis tanakae]|uniref:Uncharacterized protein n=1 Tax=Liparis tanakae TaxID=230148 RepID=A0A4Z2HM70_9TELE|nr:hypothetical protein EYF80_022853 [Liparis tanakae]
MFHSSDGPGRRAQLGSIRASSGRCGAERGGWGALGLRGARLRPSGEERRGEESCWLNNEPMRETMEVDCARREEDGGMKWGVSG